MLRDKIKFIACYIGIYDYPTNLSPQKEQMIGFFAVWIYWKLLPKISWLQISLGKLNITLYMNLTGFCYIQITWLYHISGKIYNPTNWTPGPTRVTASIEEPIQCYGMLFWKKKKIFTTSVLLGMDLLFSVQIHCLL